MRVIHKDKLPILSSDPLPLALISLVVPTEPCQVNILRYKKMRTQILETEPSYTILLSVSWRQFTQPILSINPIWGTKRGAQGGQNLQTK
jgi:hypothetical protein